MADKIAGVIGYPVEHSLSPRLHNFWLKQLGIEGEYMREEVAPEALGDFLRNLPKLGWQGCNITLPHKEAAMQYLDEIEPSARKIGAVNTVVVRGGKLIGSNTDAYGFAENIGPHLKGKKKAVVLGAGGAASAVWSALLTLGFEEIVVTNRTEAKLAKVEGSPFIIRGWEERSATLEGADLLVNTTSLGMVGKEKLDIDLVHLPLEALVTDIVYTPLITPLLDSAKARGNAIVDGLGMLIYQAVPGFEAWFGQKPPLSERTMKTLKDMLA